MYQSKYMKMLLGKCDYFIVSSFHMLIKSLLESVIWDKKIAGVFLLFSCLLRDNCSLSQMCQVFSMWKTLYNCSWEVYIFSTFSRNTSFLWNYLLPNNCLSNKIMMFYVTDTILVKFFRVIFILFMLSLLSAHLGKDIKINCRWL